MRVFVALGSNLGDRWRHLRDAVDSLPGVVATSPVYETAPEGGPGGQDDYLNCVVQLELADSFTARQLLGICHRLESAANRVRGGVRWGPRTLDVDVVVADGAPPDGIVLPHPRAHERAFVLAPWQAIDPEAEIPGRGAVRDLLADLDTSSVTALADVELQLPE